MTEIFYNALVAFKITFNGRNEEEALREALKVLREPSEEMIEVQWDGKHVGARELWCAMMDEVTK